MTEAGLDDGSGKQPDFMQLESSAAADEDASTGALRDHNGVEAAEGAEGCAVLAEAQPAAVPLVWPCPA
jgi:hypothetical protein